MRNVWRQCSDERGFVLMIALFIMAILLVLGVFLVRMSATEGDIAYNAVWAEGSFFAADAAISVGLDQLTPTLVNSTVANTTIGSVFGYQGTIAFSGTNQAAGYSLGSGTGYNPGGFVFYTFTLQGSGTGPRSAQRTLNVQAWYGPIAQ